MRLVISWLREFVDIDASAGQIAEKVGLRGFEVAAIDTLAGGDAVIDFEVTANRPDCLSVLGLAREVSTAFDVPLRIPPDTAPTTPMAAGTRGGAAPNALPIGRSDDFQITIEDEALCPRYAGVAAAVRIGPSPSWLADRLHAAGVRPISNIVDITNYVNIEIGQPMHAFDLARLAGPELRARRARPGEVIRTLDGVERRLEPEMLVIADRDRAQAVAGVMGGAESEVSASTERVAFESAYFTAASVRRTSKRLGLKTEASSRFERGADIGAQVVAIERAAGLMARLGAGHIVGPIVDCYPHQRSPRTLHLRRHRLEALLGVRVPDREVERILTALGLRVLAAGDGWDAVVPLFRVDLLREVDLIEEVGRHYGFERLEPTFPPITAPVPPPDPRIPRDRLVRGILNAAGLSEAVTFGFLEARAVEPFQGADGSAPIAIANPLSGKFDTLRPLILPGLVDAVAHNRRHGRRDVRLFEIGARFSAAGETRGLAVAWTGGATPEHWSAPTREVDFFDVKGVVERVCGSLGVPVRMAPAAGPFPGSFLGSFLGHFLLSGQAASVVVDAGPSRGASVGIVGQLSPGVADVRGLPRQDRVIVAELDLDAVERARIPADERSRPLPRFPFIVRDVSIVVSDTLPAEIIRGTIQAAADDPKLPAPLVETSVFDRYRGKGVPEGSVSLSLRLTFQSADRTLTDVEVQGSFDAILAALVREHGATQR